MVIMGISKISKSMGDIFILRKKEINITHTYIYIIIYMVCGFNPSENINILWGK